MNRSHNCFCHRFSLDNLHNTQLGALHAQALKAVAEFQNSNTLTLLESASNAGERGVAAQRSIAKTIGNSSQSSNALRTKISSIERSFGIFQYGI
ncbi:MAG: hypothetical protein DMG05_30190 [Acidobacteria bacterium]|nr:MAG: hypothetical protein DMG05_30190 [Acidobacteriota bacterium]